jgi:hypothetical protein
VAAAMRTRCAAGGGAAQSRKAVKAGSQGRQAGRQAGTHVALPLQREARAWAVDLEGAARLGQQVRAEEDLREGAVAAATGEAAGEGV